MNRRFDLGRALFKGQYAQGGRHARATLGHLLVFKNHRTGTGLFKLTHGAHDIDGIAIARIGVGHHRHRHRIGDIAHYA